MMRGFPLLLWGLLCVGFWALFARDLITILICAAISTPITLFVLRTYREDVSHSLNS